MADVGVLNLQIHDNSEQTVSRLDAIAGALGRVKAAVEGGIKLAGISTQLQKIADVVNNSISDTTLNRLRHLTDALQGLQGLGDVRVNIRVTEQVEDLRNAIGGATTQVEAMERHFENVARQTETANEAAQDFCRNMRSGMEVMQNTSWVEGWEKFRDILYDIMRMKSRMALPGSQDNAMSTNVNNGWSYWKDGAIPGEGSVSGPAGYFENVALSVREVKEATREATQTQTDYNRACEEAIEKNRELNAVMAEKYKANSPQTFEDVFYGIRNGQVLQNDLMSQWLHGGGNDTERAWAIKNMSERFGMTEDEVRGKLAELLGETGQAVGEASEKLSKLEEVAQRVASAVGDTFSSLKSGVKTLLSPVTNLIKQFGRIAKYRALRAVIKNITEGFREGVENVYWYSREIGSSFAPAMDSAASSLQQMKNSIGAAAAPLIQALIPYLQQAVNWFINLVNYANQFFALLRGQTTWTRALPATTSAFTKTEKAAKSTGAALKDLLADWDELNIIQSQSGGGSGGAGTTNAEDYLKMFEEVGTFDKRLKGLVDGIKDQFGSVWNLVKDIGLGLLGWNVSKAFTGFIGALGGILAAGEIIKLTFDIVTMLDDQYMNTGDKMWLLADLLTTAVGAYFMNKVLGSVAGGKFGFISIPLMFSISALASIFANLSRTDVSALSEESIYLSLESALKGGVAAGYLAYLAEGTLGAALGGGAVGAIATFGIAVTLKAAAQVAADDINGETIAAGLIGIGALGLGGATTAMLLGGGAAGAAGMAMLFGGAGIVTLGAAVAINAINSTVDASGITAKVIEDNLWSGGLIGAGLALGTFAVAGATVAGIVGVAGAAVTIAALFGIEAILSTMPNKVKWGNYKATEEEVKSFVSTFFTTNGGMPLDVPATIKLIKNSVDTTGIKKEEIETELATALGDFNIIQLGLASGDGYAKLKEDILGNEEKGTKGLIGAINSFVDEAKNAGKLTLEFTPKLVGDSTTDATSWYTNYVTGWDTVNQWAENQGKEIGRLLAKGEQEALSAGEQDILKTLMEQLSNVTSAITKAKTNSTAYGNLQMNIGDLSQAGFEDIAKYYKEYKDTLRTEYQALINQQYELQGELVAALGEIDPNSAAYKEAYDKYVKMGENLGNALEKSVKDSSASGEKWLTDFLVEKYANVLPELADLFESMDYGIINPINPEEYTGMSSKEIAASIREWLGTSFSEVNEDLGKYINELGLDSTAFLTESAKQMVTQYIQSAFDQNTAKEILDQLFPSSNTSGGIMNGRTLATAGVPDTTLNQSTPITKEESEAVEAESDKRILEGIDKSGLKTSVDNTNSLTQQLIQICQVIANKQFVVNLTPTSSMGRMVSQSSAKYDKVIG